MIGDPTTNDSPEAIKADIERKRSEMSEKINTIQERLSPDNLKAQAQDAIRDAVSSSSEAVSTYFRDNSKQLAQNVATTMRRNPLPSALIGLGVGWLIVEALGGNEGSSRSSVRSSRELGDDYRRGPAERVGYPRAGYSSYGSGYTGGAGYRGETQYPSNYGAQYGFQPDSSYESSQAEGLTDKAKELAGEARQRVGQFTDAVGDKVGQITDAVGDKVGQVAGQVSDKVGDMTNQTRDRAGQMGEQVGSMTEDARARAELYGEQARHRAGEWTEQASRQVQQAGAYVGDQAAYAAEQKRTAARRTGDAVQRTYYETPIWYGAVALAVGAAVGLMLPSTKLEDTWLGETRDRMMTEAEVMAEEAARRAQQVIEQVKPEVQEAAQQIVSDVKETGQMALEQVRTTGKEAVESVKETVQSGTQGNGQGKQSQGGSSTGAAGAQSSSQYTNPSSR